MIAIATSTLPLCAQETIKPQFLSWPKLGKLAGKPAFSQSTQPALQPALRTGTRASFGFPGESNFQNNGLQNLHQNSIAPGPYPLGPSGSNAFGGTAQLPSYPIAQAPQLAPPQATAFPVQSPYPAQAFSQAQLPQAQTFQPQNQFSAQSQPSSVPASPANFSNTLPTIEPIEPIATLTAPNSVSSSAFGSSGGDEVSFDELPQFAPANDPLPGNGWAADAAQSYPPIPDLAPGGHLPATGGFSEPGLNSPSHWGADTRSQILTAPVGQQFINPNAGAWHNPVGATAAPFVVETVNAPVPGFGLNPGLRGHQPTQRIGSLDDHDQDYDFETKKKEFPPFSEILATGRYFGSSHLQVLKPHFQNNTAIVVQDAVGGSGFSQPFDYSFEVASAFQVGFESKFGPGVEFNFFQFDHGSNLSQFTSDGVLQATTAASIFGAGGTSAVSTLNAGETLSASQTLEVQRFGVSFFKDWQLPVTKIGGGFGFQYVSIEQQVTAQVTDSSGGLLSELASRQDFRAFGPRLNFHYFRPIGHTRLEFFGSLSASLLFGNRDQFVENSVDGDFNQIGSNDVLTIFDLNTGVQYVRNTGHNRSFFARISLISEAWLGGGAATSVSDNFGFRGVGFGVGFNR